MKTPFFFYYIINSPLRNPKLMVIELMNHLKNCHCEEPPKGGDVAISRNDKGKIEFIKYCLTEPQINAIISCVVLRCRDKMGL